MLSLIPPGVGFVFYSLGVDKISIAVLCQNMKPLLKMELAKSFGRGTFLSANYVQCSAPTEGNFTSPRTKIDKIKHQLSNGVDDIEKCYALKITILSQK